MGIQEKVESILNRNQLLSFQSILVITAIDVTAKLSKYEQVKYVRHTDIYHGLGLQDFKDNDYTDIEKILKNNINIKEWIEATFPVLVTDNDRIREVFKNYTNVAVWYKESK